MKITGTLWRDMVISAACCLDNNKETVNNLNVFPVPDGDTGINMSLTMGGVRTGAFPTMEENLGETASKAANLMLRGARGNSGVILSLFFRGISKVWKEYEDADMDGVILGFKRGVQDAYKAVMNPTEGTILTVMRVMVETAEKALEEGFITDMKTLFDVMLSAADETLKKTPDMLPQLKQANVVDSGGYGFNKALEGMIAALNGNPVKADAPVEAKAAPTGGADFSSFDTENIKFAYCTECIVTKSEEFAGENTAEALHKYIMKLGDSVVFVDDTEIIKLHVHTNDPGKVMTEALKYGSLYTVKVENMKLQHTNLSEGSEEKPEAAKEEPAEEADSVEITKSFGFVSVCMGDGLTSLFEDIGADVVVSGGQTMNPSTDDIVNAIEKVPAETVFVFPNNKNIHLVCKQAEKIIDDRKCIVIETRSVPEGVAAMLAYDESASAEDNAAAMVEAVKNVTTVSMTYAVRDTEVGDKKIHEGETLGLLNGKIVSVEADRIACMKDLIEKVGDAEIINIFYGDEASEEEAEEIVALFTEKYPNADVVAIPGGQPVYSYIISIE